MNNLKDEKNSKKGAESGLSLHLYVKGRSTFQTLTNFHKIFNVVDLVMATLLDGKMFFDFICISGTWTICEGSIHKKIKN